LPFASRTVTVTVDVATPSAITFVVGFAVAVDCAALIVVGSPTQAPGGCRATPTRVPPGLIVAVIVLVWAVVEGLVPVASALASVVAAGCVSVFDEPLEASWTV
jgi:hypothetical protein